MPVVKYKYPKPTVKPSAKDYTDKYSDAKLKPDSQVLKKLKSMVNKKG